MHIFLSGSGDTDTSHLLELINNAILKTLFCHCKKPEKSKALLRGPTWISAVVIGWTTIHSGLKIKPEI